MDRSAGVGLVGIGLLAVTLPLMAQTAPGADSKLSEAQKADLQASKDDILKFASKDTGLTIHKPVKLVFVDRDAVNKELRVKFDEDKSNKRMERSELVLKKFGLLDQDFQLRPFLLNLLTEQIAGFYDNKTKLMTLLDWVPIDQQKPVMAHELTHALQDQKLGLRKWEDPEPEGIAKTVKEDNEHVATDEAGTAREAVLEGQAMVSFADYMLRPMGKTLKDVPQLGEQLQNGAGDQSDSPILSRAPLVLQQSLLFPYTSGMGFEQEILMKAGTNRAFTGVLDAPPNTSAEILHPQAYLAKTAMPLLHLPDLHPALEQAGWEPYDVGVMGELDVRMTAELFGGRPLATALAPNWSGGVYLAAQKKDATEQEKQTTKSIAILYSSQWKNPDSAESFFHVFEMQLPRQYDGLKRVPEKEQSGDERVYSTREGDVLLVRNGATVWVSEGFDLEMARKLRAQVEAVNPAGNGPVMQAAGRGVKLMPVQGEGLLEDLGRWTGEFGMMRAVLPR
ncbi:MAG: hypothetical protein PW735_11665 [Acidobacteriaceae bacterium]|nr:hypothetical protein [Acidobacteriaceae bacterium]